MVVKKEKKVEKVEEVEISSAKEEYQALIDAYKVQNPEKYALKEEAFTRKLNKL